jgi:hypothetical protein
MLLRGFKMARRRLQAKVVPDPETHVIIDEHPDGLARFNAVGERSGAGLDLRVA